MDGIIDHIMINANEYSKALGFYSWLLPKLGFSEKMVYGKTVGFRSARGSIWLTEAVEELRAEKFDKRRVGMRELAFAAGSKAEIDEVAQGVEKNGGRIIERPYANSQGGYQFFFSDPDGMKLEIIARKA